MEADLYRRKQEQLEIAQAQYRKARIEAEAQDAEIRAAKRIEHEKEQMRLRQRNDEIVRRFLSGEPMRSIADDVGLTRTRVQQIVLRAQRKRSSHS